VDATAGAIAAAAAAYVHVDESVVADLAVTSPFVHEVVWLDTTEQGAALGSGVSNVSRTDRNLSF
jgi:hypothetical protein